MKVRASWEVSRGSVVGMLELEAGAPEAVLGEAQPERFPRGGDTSKGVISLEITLPVLSVKVVLITEFMMD